MDGLLDIAKTAFGPLPSAVIVALRGESGEWYAAYENPAGEALTQGEEGALLLALGQELENCDGAGRDWRGVFRDRDLAVDITRYPAGEALLFIRDVTEDLRRQSGQIEASKAALQSALDAANAANKAKSDFLSNMSHDIRTPLNAIIGMTAIAQAHLDEREKVEDCLDKVALSSRHLLALINDILDMSRIESGKMTLSPEEFTMADFLHSLMAVFKPQADKKSQRVELDFTGLRHEKVKGDQLRIQQVLINILSNCVKFTPEEGTISMSVRETGEICKTGHNYAYYEFRIKDTGIGMSKAFLEKIFQPFERAKQVNKVEGTGLGMTITYNLVKMMNGEITVESEEGKGSEFTVTIPLEQTQEDESEIVQLHGLRILAAEADGVSRRNLREILSDLGMECDIVATAWELSDLAAQARMEGRDYFAILMGWRLPVVDGVQACRELRAMLGREIPIILMSSYEWTLTADQMRKYGVSAFVPKPLFRSRLGQTLYSFTQEGRAKRGSKGKDEEELFTGKNILLVEDNEINREIGIELIEMLGAKVSCAENGQRAVEAVKNSPPGTYDLIFMDLQMPVMDGYEATKAIRALDREDCGRIPIVAMSANAFVEDIRACKRAGMNSHVPKPVSIQSLTDVMSRYLIDGGDPA